MSKGNIQSCTGKKIIIQLKGNQKELLEQCNDVVRFYAAKSSISTTELNKNRIETRTISVYQDDSSLIENEEWSKGIDKIIHIERRADVYNTKEKKYISRREEAIYLTNFDVTAKPASLLVRNHWSIENKNHYVRDVSLGEDESRIRVVPENMACLRSFALNIMRKNKVKNIKGELYLNSLKFQKIYEYNCFI